jgi:hypothetical protein
MDKLNTDCLLHVFLELDVQQKINLERVCKKWFRVLRVSQKFTRIIANLRSSHTIPIQILNK